MSKFRSPLNGPARITSSFQAHKSDPGRAQFAGIDLVYASGESYRMPIVASSRQKVISVQNDFIDPKQPLRAGEKYIYSQDLSNPSITFLYLHNDKNLVSAGQVVESGQQIATMGFSGWTIPDNSPKGTHLHYEVRVNGERVDPALYTDFNNFGNTNESKTITQSTNNMNTNSITVQTGWGLSHVAQAAGLPMTEKTYNDIYNLNQGWRGSTDWRSLNTRMGPGDVLKVRPDVQVTPVNNPVIDVNNEAQEWKSKYDEQYQLNESLRDEYVKMQNKLNEALKHEQENSKKLIERYQGYIPEKQAKEMADNMFQEYKRSFEPTMIEPSMSLPKETLNRVDEVISKKVSENIEMMTGQKVGSEQLGVFVSGRVKKLFSTRLWSAVGGTVLTAQIGESATQTIISAVVLFSLYIISEAYIYYSNKNK